MYTLDLELKNALSRALVCLTIEYLKRLEKEYGLFGWCRRRDLNPGHGLSSAVESVEESSKGPHTCPGYTTAAPVETVNLA